MVVVEGLDVEKNEKEGRDGDEMDEKLWRKKIIG